ncbi:MAG TPA: Mur ligase family protein [Candidatus Hydrogenedentes bacterium]|nr:Mur ligase family protein [Candidatus Hydrogenedentota bacterium]HOS01785.1 Mur ligase family protein [Candidatus Hydrogenedentota bacterium]
MQQPTPPRPPRAHFSGIGGTAMVAGARLALEAGWNIRGSDLPLYPPTSEMVKALGVPVATEYAAANLDWDPDVVIIGNALSRGNPEVEAALERRLHIASLPEWLKDVVLRRRRPIAICGTHGKTTTTALTAFLLDRAGAAPGFLIGGEPLDFPHSARLSDEGSPFVIEGDEYDTAFFDKRAKFLHYLPEIAVVTSIEFDHGDIYDDLAGIERAFRLMLRQLPQTGSLAICADSPEALALRPHAPCRTLTYGFAQNADFRGEIAHVASGLLSLRTWRHGKRWGEFRVPLTGRHNAQNALAALAVASIIGCAPDALRQAMPDFKGVRRRMEIFAEHNGITFVDDFAHHPTAIRETIAAARMRWPAARLWAIFEPRSNTTVTNRFQGELREAFAQADIIRIGPLHRAERLPEDQRLDRTTLTQELQSSGRDAQTVDAIEEIVAGILEKAQTGDVVLFLSNGAFGGIFNRVKQALESAPE